MLDLFDTSPVPGLASLPAIVSETEERYLIAAIDVTELSPFKFQGWEGKRLTTSFGFSYDFETQRATRADPIPDWLLPIRQRMAAFAELDPERLIQALLIRYDVGAGIGWHRDRPIYENVVGLSLGRRPTCGSVVVGAMTASTAPRSRSNRGPPTICQARPGTSGSTASSRWIARAGRSPSATPRFGVAPHSGDDPMRARHHDPADHRMTIPDLPPPLMGSRILRLACCDLQHRVLEIPTRIESGRVAIPNMACRFSRHASAMAALRIATRGVADCNTVEARRLPLGGLSA